MPDEIAYAPFRLPPDASVDERLIALETQLAACATALDENRVHSMEGMDKEVEILCRRIMAMPSAEATPYIEQLQILSDAFTALGDVMYGQRDQIRDELSSLQARHKALRAYGMRGPAATPGEDAAYGSEEASPAQDFPKAGQEEPDAL